MAHRVPISALVEKQRARLVKIDEQLGRLMTKRVDEEEVLAELLLLEKGRNP